MEQPSRNLTVRLSDKIYWELKKHVADNKETLQEILTRAILKEMERGKK